ncbi:MAG: phenylalanine--tRNA ligase subunit beta [Desulfonatronovibrionaceae bacterium]
MLLSLDWLRELTPYEGEAEALAERLTMLGLEVEEIIDPFAHVRNLVAGYVAECEKHPNADNLSVCRVDIGQGDLLPIVCGAPNVQSGQKVAVAPVGTVLPGGMKIKKAKLRGQRSVGMICSETEMELGQDSSGIMVLADDALPGKPLPDCLGLERTVFDVSITPNRADCLSMLGLAREVAAAYKLPLNIPAADVHENPELDAREDIDISIDNPELCPLYQARLITGCRVGKSPAWLRYRLMAVGIRPVNNLVDVTNYVLMELGHPLHAFDRDLLRKDAIRIKTAAEGQKFTTLDGMERTLEDSDLLVCDGSGPVALAGIMGGANSEISEKSRNVLLECAVFNPPTVRKTARRLGISSEASFRFERGVDQAGSDLAVNRAAAMTAELSGGKVAANIIKSEPRPFSYRRIAFRPERAKELLALDVDADFCRETLGALGCGINEAEGGQWEVTPPSFRLDLEREVDLTEEVGRVYGLDRVPVHLPRVSQRLDSQLNDRTYELEQLVRDWARGVGLSEAVNYSFVGKNDLDCLCYPQQGRVCIFNPLSEEQDVLRTNLLPGMLRTLRVNVGQGAGRLRMFEVAHTFFQDPESDTNTREHNRLALMLYGERHPRQWPYAQETTDYSDIKGLVEHLVHSFNLPGPRFRSEGGHPCLSPCVSIRIQGENLGVMGQVRPEQAREYKARGPVWYAGVDLDRLQGHYLNHRIKFTELPRYPFAKRDMTVVAPVDMPYGRIRETVLDMDLRVLESVHLIDVYQPEGAGGKNLTLRFTYRDPEKTLKDKEVDRVHSSIGEHLLQTLDVRFP